MRKKSIILLTAVLCFSCGESSDSKCRDFDSASFSLKLTLTERETGKDSRWISQSVKISGRHACYSRTSDGFRTGDDKSGSCRLDETTLDRVRKRLLEYGFHRDLHESKSTAGPGRSVFLHAEVFMDGKRTVAEISGMLNDWAKRDIGRV